MSGEIQTVTGGVSRRVALAQARRFARLTVSAYQEPDDTDAELLESLDFITERAAGNYLASAPATDPFTLEWMATFQAEVHRQRGVKA